MLLVAIRGRKKPKRFGPHPSKLRGSRRQKLVQVLALQETKRDHDIQETKRVSSYGVSPPPDILLLVIHRLTQKIMICS